MLMIESLSKQWRALNVKVVTLSVMLSEAL